MKSNKNLVILVVDDNRNIADLYTAWLSDSHTVKTAYGGEDALRQLDAAVDIVLLDRQMPDLGGEQVLSRIQAYDFDCQVALVTSIKLDYDSLPLGFDDYLHKPVTKSALHTLVESLRIRLDYSTKLQEYIALVSKRAALQATKDSDEFAEHPSVRKLDKRISDLQQEVDGLLAEFSDEEYRAVFATFPSDDDCETGSQSLG